MNFRLPLATVILLSILAATSSAQDGVSTGGAARTKYLGSLGIIPSPAEVVVEDFVNYHRHEIARPKAGAAVGLELRFGGESVAPGRDAILQVGLSTALSHDREHLRPLNLALVIDKSGSMAADNKLVRVKQSLLELVSKLRPNDILSIVAFDSEAGVILPAGPVGNGQQARSLIQSLEPGNSTNLNSGLMLGYKEAAKHYSRESTNRVILLTDGIANVGEVDPEKIAANSLGYNDKGVDLSTIGVGLDLNKELLRRLAKSGRGLNHFVADSEDIKKVFDKEVQSLLSPVATEPNLEIEIGPGFQLEQIYGYEPKINGGRVRIKLDNMNTGMTEVVLLRLKRVGEGRLTARAHLSYFDLDRNRQVGKEADASIEGGGKSEWLSDDSVAKNYTIANLAQAIHDMSVDCEARRFVQAESHLNSAVDAAYERYPSCEDPDIKRTMTMALQYQTALRKQNADTKPERSRDIGEVHGRNLIPNGDFALGNCGFLSPNLPYTAPTDNCLWPGSYTVAPSFLHPKLHRLVADQEFLAPKQPHGGEQVLFANAGGTEQMTVWTAKVHCRPHATYRISFQAVSITPGAASIPTFEIRINSDRSDPQVAAEGAYKEISMIWDSKNETSATIRILRLPMPQNGRLIGIANIEMIEDQR
jgi:Mg-chelatase subunit ChlD